MSLTNIEHLQCAVHSLGTKGKARAKQNLLPWSLYSGGSHGKQVVKCELWLLSNPDSFLALDLQ